MVNSGNKIYTGAGQVPFSLRLPESELYSLDRFVEGDENGVALMAARGFGEEDSPKVLVITGPSQSGKTHLLKGIALANMERHAPAILSAAELATMPEEEAAAFLRSFHDSSMVLVDDLHRGAGSQFVYDGLFHLFNAVRGTGGYMAFAMKDSPAKSGYLPDYLYTRLLTGMVVTLARPGEGERMLILDKMARDCSISLTPQAMKFVLERSKRSVAGMKSFVERLESSLGKGHKRIGLQLIRRVLESDLP